MDHRATRLGYGLFLTLSCLVLGAATGGILSRFTRQAGMGWDQIAHALGGMMFGALGGGVLAIVLARRLRLPILRTVTVITTLLAGSMVTFVAMRIRQEQARGAAEASRGHPVTPKAGTVPATP